MQILFPSYLKRRYCSFLVPARDTQGVIYLRLVYWLSHAMSRKTAGHIMPTSRTLRRPQDYGFDNWIQLITNRAVREDILSRPDLSRAAKTVLGFLLRARRTLRWIVFSVKTLAREIHYHPRSVQRACRLLEARGLLIVKRRQSLRSDPTSNLYIPTWHPYRAPAATSPVATKRTTDSTDHLVPLSSSEPRHPAVDTAQEASSHESDPVTLPGGATTICHHPFADAEPETLTASTLDVSAPDTISKELLRKSDQPGAATHTENDTASPASTPPTTLDDVAHTLKNLHIPLATRRLEDWIERFSAQRILTVAEWIQHAPSGIIRHRGGWLYRALTENWTAPSWEIARKKREDQQQQIQQRAVQEAEKRTQEMTQWQQDAEHFALTWERVAPLVTAPEGEALRERAAALAHEQLRSLAGALFQPGSITWRTLHIQAWKELCQPPRPEGWSLRDSVSSLG